MIYKLSQKVDLTKRVIGKKSNSKVNKKSMPLIISSINNFILSNSRIPLTQVNEVSIVD